MAVHEGKYEFLTGGEFDQTYRYIDELLSIGEFKTVAETYIANFDRIRFLHDLPIQLISWSDHLATCHIKARLIHGFPVDGDTHNDEDEYRDTVNELFIKEGNKRDPRGWGASQLDGMMNWEDKNTGANNPAVAGVQALFAAMIMAAYAALEALASDLWIAALNKKSKFATNWIARNPDKKLPTYVFSKYGFNLEDKMGTVLHLEHKVSFEVWSEIKEAYSHAFGGDLDKCFEPAEEIRKAEKTRHLFAHRGGIIDQKFKDEMKRYSEYDGLVVGERLELTGEIVRKHVDACLKCGAELLTTVDQLARDTR